ncbi:hypothetical protein ACSQ67_008917 [Phaseolus vulgaris]
MPFGSGRDFSTKLNCFNSTQALLPTITETTPDKKHKINSNKFVSVFTNSTVNFNECLFQFELAQFSDKTCELEIKRRYEDEWLDCTVPLVTNNTASNNSTEWIYATSTKNNETVLINTFPMRFWIRRGCKLMFPLETTTSPFRNHYSVFSDHRI